MTKLKFKKGDIVKVNEIYMRTFGPNRHFKSDKVYTISKSGPDVYDRTINLVTISGVKNGNNFHEKFFDLVLSSTFKVGDIVITNKFKNSDNESAYSVGWVDALSEYVGQTGKIRSISSSGGYDVHGWSWPASALTLVETKHIQTEYTLEQIASKLGIDVNDLRIVK
jgi:hypothetical protein